VYGDPDGDFVAEAGSLTGYINIKRSINNKYIAKELHYTSVKDESGTTIGTSGATCVSLLNSDYLNTTTKIQSFDNVNFQNTIAAGQILSFTDQSGSLKVDNVPREELFSQTLSAPTSAGEFQGGARLVTDAYGTAPSATAGTLVSFGTTNVSAAGAQSTSGIATGMITVVTDAASGDELLVEGVIKMSSNTGWSTAKMGEVLYMSATAGAVTTTAPSTSGDFVRVIGYVLDGANSTIYFKPSQDWVELS
jgi:hypothetical protein